MDLHYGICVLKQRTCINVSAPVRHRLDSPESSSARIASRISCETFHVALRTTAAGEREKNSENKIGYSRFIAYFVRKLDKWNRQKQQLETRNKLIRIRPTLLELHQLLHDRKHRRSSTVEWIRIRTESQQNHENIRSRRLQCNAKWRRFSARLDGNVDKPAIEQ